MAAPNTQKSTGHSSQILAFLEKSFLEILRAELKLAPLGKSKTLGQRQGSTVKFHRWSDLGANTVALAEGVTPDGLTPSETSVTATIKGYGDFVMVSDFLQAIAINDTLLDMRELLARRAAITIDSLVRNELDSAGTQNFADTANNSSIANVETGTDNIGSLELKIILKALVVADVPAFADGFYKFIIHPLMEFDLLAETAASDFIVLNTQTKSDVSESGHIGNAFGLKLMRSTNIRADATSTNTYGNIALGRDAFGTIDLASMGLHMIIKSFNDTGTEDPLNQRSSVAYKFYYVAKVLEAVRAQVLWAYNAG